jgi:hypothetical protein
VVLLLVVLLQFAKHLRGGFELIWREVLVAHDQHMMLGKGATQEGASIRVDRPRKIEADDFGAGVIRQGRDGEGCHGLSPPRWIFNKEAIAGRGDGSSGGGPLKRSTLATSLEPCSKSPPK